MKKLLLALALLATFSTTAVAGEIPHPIECPPDAVCPQAAPAEDPAVDETAEVIAEVVVDLATVVLSLI